MTGFQNGYVAALAGQLEALRRAWRGTVLVVMSASALTGCISVATPDKPIVIELNINIKQEVIYRLAADAGKTIDTNKDIF
ncbi:MAG: YnbE family lipoprotein [Pseudomonadota bacterium]|nr:YnbE family lipoprotein [Pseudomonadota bacterium]